MRMMELPDELATVLNAKKIAGKLFQIGVGRQRIFIDSKEVGDDVKIQPNQRLIMIEIPKRNAIKEGEEEIYEYEEEEVIYEYEESTSSEYTSYVNSSDDDETVSSEASSSDDQQVPNMYDM